MAAPRAQLYGPTSAIKGFLRKSARVIWWALTLQLPRRLRERRAWFREEELKALKREGRLYDAWILLYDTPDDRDRKQMHLLAQALRYRPTVSILMPLQHPAGQLLRQTIESLVAQVYENWELLVADTSPDPASRDVLASYAARDRRIRTCSHGSGRAACALNGALAVAHGELVGVVDPGDMLPPHALLLVVRAFNSRPELAYVYSDEDKIDPTGRRSDHYFKPDWNPELMLSQDYASRLFVTRLELVRHSGGFRGEYAGAMTRDLSLRVTRSLGPGAIGHVPHVLYHRLVVPTLDEALTPASLQSRDRLRALEDHLSLTGTSAAVTAVAHDGLSVRYALPASPPYVTAIVPSTGRRDLLEGCVRGLLERTRYGKLEIILAMSESDRANALKRPWLDSVSREPLVRILTYPDRPFHYAWVNNWAARQARGELLLFLNDDTETVHEDWLEIMAAQALQARVGAVGALLLYPDDTIQHAGVILAPAGPDHLYRDAERTIPGYQNRARLSQDLPAVTGACMLVRRQAFERLQGFDEFFAISYNDVDFCLRLRRAGWRVVFTPDAVLYHHETASLGDHYHGREAAYLREAGSMTQRWREQFEHDPMHNPNLQPIARDPGQLAFPPRVLYPWRDALASQPRRAGSGAIWRGAFRAVAQRKRSTSESYLSPDGGSQAAG